MLPAMHNRIALLLSTSLGNRAAQSISASSLKATLPPQNIVYPADANMLNVRNYGAKGDGVTDDTAAIRRAVQGNLTNHRTLFFPAGTYLVTDMIEWKGKDGLFGAFLTWQGVAQTKLSSS
jgi:polygalacturonase